MSDDDRARSKARRKWLVLVAKLVIFALLIAAVWATLDSAFRELQQHRWTVNFGWLAIAGALYLAGILPSSLYWYRMLMAAEQDVSLGGTVRAFYVSQVGKYVPGKAMVVILRAGFLAAPGVETTVVVTSVFVETLTTMAAASLLATVCLVTWYPDKWLFVVGAIGALLVTGLPTVPAVFKYIIRRLKIGKIDLRAADRLAHLSPAGFVTGWLMISFGWVLQALSLWAILVSIDAPSTEVIADLPHVLATICLGVVGGFLVAFMPGGIGPRDIILAELMAPRFGSGNALVAAIICRLVWLVSELVVAGVWYVLGHQRLRWLPPESIPDEELPIE